MTGICSRSGISFTRTLRLRRATQREGEHYELNEGEAKSGAPGARGGGSPGGQRE